MSAIGEKRQAEIEGRLGRPIAENESNGLPHKETRDTMTALHDHERQKSILKGPEPTPMSEVQKIDALIAQHEEEKAKAADPTGWSLQQERKKVMAEAAAKSAYDARMADPKRMPALKAATDWLIDILFTPGATLAEEEAARFLLQLAWITSDWKLFSEEMNRAKQTRATALDPGAEKTEADWKQMRAEKDRLNQPFVL